MDLIVQPVEHNSVLINPLHSESAEEANLA
jgi:hypothetical protein